MNDMVAGAVLWIIGYFLTCSVLLVLVIIGLYLLARLIEKLMGRWKK